MIFCDKMMKEIEKIKEKRELYYYQGLFFGVFSIIMLALYVWIDTYLNEIEMLLTTLLGLSAFLSFFVAFLHLSAYYDILLKIENLKKEIEEKITK